ncbi:hypothetical protein V6N12_065360 [Hibiscus sabdariffa]|uniref:Uncharacterized protein n=1 Tax=Hibiscus sabdariffa TaxID=183260 RepID=A0ABR2G8G3_9ROSI
MEAKSQSVSKPIINEKVEIDIELTPRRKIVISFMVSDEHMRRFVHTAVFVCAISYVGQSLGLGADMTSFLDIDGVKLVANEIVEDAPEANLDDVGMDDETTMSEDGSENDAEDSVFVDPIYKNETVAQSATEQATSDVHVVHKLSVDVVTKNVVATIVPRTESDVTETTKATTDVTVLGIEPVMFVVETDPVQTAVSTVGTEMYKSIFENAPTNVASEGSVNSLISVSYIMSKKCVILPTREGSTRSEPKIALTCPCEIVSPSPSSAPIHSDFVTWLAT